MLKHKPVLLEEVLSFLINEAPGIYLDCTFGGGGHARAILEGNGENRLVAIDTDPEAAERAKTFGEEFGKRFTFYGINFGEIDKIEENDFDGILFDLGVSSFQLDDVERGFSFRNDAAADMRMDTRKGMPAAEFLEKATYDELVKAVRDYGEEKKWKRVVDAIIQARGTGALERTQSLSELVSDVVGNMPFGRKRIHPATKTFQGIRMAVNKELEMIENALPVAFKKLKLGGKLAVISFHSLEDRIIKRFFKTMAGMPEHGKDSRFQDERTRYAKLVTRKPVTAGEAEIAENPRSRSAKLRILKKEVDV
ncbi:MAG: 16S rRNA (cytosine(1402)-N(4))-methyltransferase [Verrucomicrobia bacterium CG_4_10_14_3_um_filter_43_23]|nr:MAG: 16S rRNA (cytosine(1402)-N(4))-methyltransferase [Verrucomicrobia bacterium CG1_02_43_26]PIP60051.1 MAG: 16S rRNA (cytosine(1402)-N(4))-methyltransferase [Verrucomicrobia bacterium CG22_combo_CG10-13_8_21_14_all_43_17]PIX58778.1 MAG: 16S rRNA (cytosine(1402)-N(4))-methyltransferase [Verrucomicrobia bacterium CG_4_10_14_3_um_filter_43_23]PIY62651.1 MAG: 16S rRNA (cytosine(1402)-N(4))-methyltransferase [Verrucomicrobia bacterium CG_4_10_14_0_8_um_filter_43_34]PJA43417.1 MAG: 16S rRNA (cyt